MKTFLSIGECMVELAPAGGGLLQKSFAGDTFNTAWYARKLFGDTWSIGYFTALGDCAFSTEMLEFMKSSGVDVRHVSRIQGATPGLYIIQLMNGERNFSYWRSTSAAKQLARDEDKLMLACSEADVIYVSGITFAILDQDGRVALLSALAQAKDRGAMIVYDPNFRRRLWPNLADARAMNGNIARLADVVMTGRDDEQTLNGLTTPEDAILHYAKLGATHVVVKNGSGSVVIFKDGAISAVRPQRLEHVVDTTAAGDSFNAGYLACFLAGTGVDTAAMAGCAVAAKVIGATGALVEFHPTPL